MRRHAATAIATVTAISPAMVMPSGQTLPGSRLTAPAASPPTTISLAPSIAAAEPAPTP